MKKLIILLSVLVLLTFSQTSYALLNLAKVTIVAVDENGKPIKMVRVGIVFERNKFSGAGINVVPVNGFTDSEGQFTAQNSNDSDVITFGVEKEGYYFSTGVYKFNEKGTFGWKPWNPELKILMRKIENPVAMYARDTKRSKIQIPVVDKDIGFDLIKFDWVEPYGIGDVTDFLINLSSMVESVKNYNFTVTIKFEGKNGILSYVEDTNNGSQYKLPRRAPDFGYQKLLKIYDRTEKGEARDVSWKNDQHYLFRVRSVVDKYNNLEKAMYGKIVGDIHLGPRKNGTAYIEFTYYLNPDYTRNLEFDPKRNLFENLPPLEQVTNP